MDKVLEDLVAYRVEQMKKMWPSVRLLDVQKRMVRELTEAECRGDSSDLWPTDLRSFLPIDPDDEEPS